MTVVEQEQIDRRVRLDGMPSRSVERLAGDVGGRLISTMRSRLRGGLA
jgi:hypothetical protein